ncbi:MAG: hypothetical protein IJZ07_01055 [Clostridia bacterium]|nr:hypothetical protein [Clostridia bacterium]
MNQYVKPVIKLAGTSGASSGSCAYNLTKDDLELIAGIIGDIDVDKAFGMYEACEVQVPIESYCKFTSGELGASMAFSS